MPSINNPDHTYLKQPKAGWVSTVSVLLLVTLSLVYFPQYKYHLEGDAMGYIGSIKRYLNGEYFNAINGFWSPLSIWLTAIGAKISHAPIVTVAYVLNTLSMSGIVFMSLKLYYRYVKHNKFELWIFGLGMAVFWFVQMQVALFADGLNTLLMLIVLQLLLSKRFTEQPLMWLITGLIAAFAYFAKSYSFYAVPLITIAITAFRIKKNKRFPVKKFVLIVSVVCLTMILFSLPWIFILHHKYQVWTLSNAGTLNNSWFAFGIMYFSNDIHQLVPPPYPNALSCWDDLWFHKGTMYGLFDSPKIVVLRLRRLLINLMNWPAVTASLSPFYFVTWVLCLAAVFSNTFRQNQRRIMPVILAFLLFPVGYFTLLVSGRYIWFTVPLCMVISAYLLRHIIYPFIGASKPKLLFTLFVLSWLPSGAMQLIQTRTKGKQNYEIAQRLNEMGIKNGSFCTNDGMNDMNRIFNIAYYTNNQYYMNFNSSWKIEDVLKDANKFGVKYYFHFYNNADRDLVFKNTNGALISEISNNQIEGLRIYKIAP